MAPVPSRATRRRGSVSRSSAAACGAAPARTGTHQRIAEEADAGQERNADVERAARSLRKAVYLRALQRPPEECGQRATIMRRRLLRKDALDVCVKLGEVIGPALVAQAEHRPQATHRLDQVLGVPTPGALQVVPGAAVDQVHALDRTDEIRVAKRRGDLRIEGILVKSRAEHDHMIGKGLNRGLGIDPCIAGLIHDHVDVGIEGLGIGH
jgi:hypothetical protein